MPYAKAKDGTMLYYKDWGRGDPVVLMHGWPLTGDTFDDLAIKLVEAGKRCIIPDRRGFGRSEQPWDGHDYDTYADDVAAILEDAGINQPVALVGFSMGGGEVARFLSKQGKGRVSAAVLASSVVPKVAQSDDWPDGVPQSALDDVTKQMKEDRAGFLQTFLKQFYGVGFLEHPVSQGVLDAGFQQGMMSGARPFYAAAAAWAGTDFRPDLPAFEGVPTLILHGTSDKNVPIEGTGRKAAEALPHATLIEYDGSPHGIFETDKERFCKDVVEFLTRETRGTTADTSASAIPLTN
ncbi:alpha/beta fold hydrolase [Sphingomonas astaxanthinifaciens]|uniref:Arylesterase n=1 Tax=Sphingomonas astaxanthinifaciens DSM 22298 TaxID=1123267 RepID=A0ABQ5Z981_9SPHN|nr:alpha/beta hydrolase [Sphingomonas astaxanthinifaciens]GLR48056.1 arylesterase [Sphingomonas astaxanthinifaciens DSM 22298]